MFVGEGSGKRGDGTSGPDKDSGGCSGVGCGGGSGVGCGGNSGMGCGGSRGAVVGYDEGGNNGGVFWVEVDLGDSEVEDDRG